MHGRQVGEEQLLENAYRNFLQTAVDHGISTIAFPSISAGIYSYSVDQAALVAIKMVRRFCEENMDKSDIVRFVLFDPKMRETYDRVVKDVELKK